MKGGEQSKDAIPEERRKYFREKQAEWRNQEKKPEEKKEGEGSSGMEGGGKGGRPPLDPESGPMNAEALKEYRVDNLRQHRKQEKLRKIRQAAVSMRRDRGGREELLEDSSTEEELEVSLREEQREEEREDERKEEREEEREEKREQVMSDREQLKDEGEEEKVMASSERSFYEKMRSAKDVMGKMTMLEKVDVTVKMMVSHDLNEEKMGLRMSPKDVKAHLALGLSKLTPYHVRERSRKVLDILESHQEGERMLVKLLQEEVYRDEVAASLLTAGGLQVEVAFLTKRQQGRKVAMEESVRLTSNRRSGLDRDAGVRMAIAVASKCAFTLEQHGDQQVFAEVLGSSVMFANKVLQAVSKGETSSLFKRSRRRDSLVASEWPKVLRAFLDRPLYSRLVPGNDTTSLYYGHRVPKVLLLMTRTQILQEFKAENPDCSFTSRTLLKEIPANYVTMTTRDFGRNACVLHTNFRHILRHLTKQEILQNTLSSCRFLSAQSICSTSPSFSALDPLTWSERCVVGDCQECPSLAATCPQEKQGVQVELAQWQTKFCEIKQKKIHSLFSTAISLQALVTKFNAGVSRMTGHVYRAARVWDTYKTNLASIKPGDLLYVCDYQMNGSVVHVDATTSSKMGANTVQFCIYPVYVVFGLPDGTVVRGGFVFLSRDLKHDRNQVGWLCWSCLAVSQARAHMPEQMHGKNMFFFYIYFFIFSAVSLSELPPLAVALPASGHPHVSRNYCSLSSVLRSHYWPLASRSAVSGLPYGCDGARWRAHMTHSLYVWVGWMVGRLVRCLFGWFVLIFV